LFQIYFVESGRIFTALRQPPINKGAQSELNPQTIGLMDFVTAITGPQGGKIHVGAGGAVGFTEIDAQTMLRAAERTGDSVVRLPAKKSKARVKGGAATAPSNSADEPKKPKRARKSDANVGGGAAAEERKVMMSAMLVVPGRMFVESYQDKELDLSQKPGTVTPAGGGEGVGGRDTVVTSAAVPPQPIFVDMTKKKRKRSRSKGPSQV